MKKTMLILTGILVLAVLATSCKKDEENKNQTDVQNNQKKIEKIFWSCNMQYDGYSLNFPRCLHSLWDWEADQLKSISYFDDGIEITKALFSYQNNHLSNVSYEGEVSPISYTYTYQDGRVVSIQEYNGNELAEEFQYTYSGNVVSRITCTSYYDKESFESPLRSALLLAMYGGKTPKTIGKTRSNEIFDLEWSQGNLVRLTRSSEGYSNTEVRTFDNKINPVRNSFFGFGAQCTPYLIPASENNIVEMVETNLTGACYTYIYTYTYDGDYPVIQNCSLQSYTINGVPQNRIDQEVLYYEYK